MATSLTAWLRAATARDALLTAWQAAETDPVTDYEADALAVTALAAQSGTPAAIGQPGGRSRLPLLAAVHSASLQLPGYPSPFSPRRRGAVVLATRHTVRREELLRLDAAGVPVSPALRAVRLRQDGLCVPLSGGRPQRQDSLHRLVLVREFTAKPDLAPMTVIIDGASQDDSYLNAAREWVDQFDATVVLFEDAARRRWPDDALVYSGGWAAINAAGDHADDGVASLAAVRGHVAVIDAGPQADLAGAAALFADGRRRGQLPPALLEAAVLWRRLDELVVPLQDYDAACPRWHTPTLSERLDDLADVRASAFPTGWQTWAQMCWAGIKESLAAARARLAVRSEKAVILAELVDADLRSGLSVDLALPSRTARDATLRYLANAGVVVPVDGRLSIRSVGDINSWGPPRATLFVAPPTMASRHRLTAADVGPLNVLCYQHEIAALRASLSWDLDEPLSPIGPLDRLLPPALNAVVDLPATAPPVVLASATMFNAADRPRRTTRFAHLADAVDVAALTVLTGQSDEELPNLPDDESDYHTTRFPSDPPNLELRAVLPLTVVATGSDQPCIVKVPASRKILRILAGTARSIPVLEVVPSMLVAGIEGPTPFERLRPMLIEARGPVARMLLGAWDQALEMATLRCGSASQLALALAADGCGVGPDAVAAWSDLERIGPRDADDIARVGRIGRHPVVESNSAAIAEVMRLLRGMHQQVGRAVGGSIAADFDAIEELEAILGPDATAVVSETVVYRVLSVGTATVLDAHLLHAPTIPRDTAELTTEQQ